MTEAPSKTSECLSRTIDGLGKVEVSVEYKSIEVVDEERPFLPPTYERVDEVYTLKVTAETGEETVAQFAGEAFYMVVDLYQRLQPREHGALKGSLA
jgi:hypothetical protein